jgi:hypothetical protein
MECTKASNAAPVFDTRSNQYHFVTRWQVEGTCGEVADVIGAPTELTRWWPAVYLDVQEVDPPDARGLGGRVRLLTKGWLPYTLMWECVVTKSQYPYGLTIEAVGDFTGRGEWTFEQDGPFVNVTYDWRITAEKPLLRRWSSVLKPVFAANHRWAMRQGEESLKLELARRRATSAAAKNAVPLPPGPITYAGIVVLGGAVLLGAGAAWLVVRLADQTSGAGRIRKSATKMTLGVLGP